MLAQPLIERHDEVGDDGLKLGHERDWERISVLTRGVDEASWAPLSVRFHEHNTSVDVPWARARKVAGETGVVSHPRAYVAKGSHAT